MFVPGNSTNTLTEAIITSIPSHKNTLGAVAPKTKSTITPRSSEAMETKTAAMEEATKATMTMVAMATRMTTSAGDATTAMIEAPDD